MTGLVHGDRQHLEQGEREQPKDDRAVDRHEGVPSHADLSDPRCKAREADQADEDGPDRRERETATPAIDGLHGSVGIVPAGDVPDDQALQQECRARQRITLRAPPREALVDLRDLLSEEPVRAERGCEASETIQREHTRRLERLDDDVLDRSLAVHEVDQGDVRRLEAQVAAGAAIPVRILDDGVRAAVTAAQVGALHAGDEAGDEGRVLDALAKSLPDPVHDQALVRTTSNAGTGRVIPLSSRSPMGVVSTRSSIAAFSL